MPRRIPKAFGRGYRKVASNPGITFGLLIGLFVAIAITTYRAEETRDVTNRIVQASPCTADPASEECQSAKRESDREQSLRDSCIPFRKVLTREAFDRATRCPRGGVVVQNSPTASQQPGPSGGRSENPVVPSVPEQPGNGNNPAPAPGPSPTPEPEPPPPLPAPTEPSQPLIDLTPVTKPVCDLTRPIAAIC